MNGQWSGEYHGDENGWITVSIEKIKQNLIGSASARSAKFGGPIIILNFSSRNSGPEHKNINIDLEYYPLFAKSYSKNGKLSFNIRPEGLSLCIEITGGIKLIGDNLLQAVIPKLSSIKGHELSWAEFKKKISADYALGYMFRGQGKPWGLTTKFHRKGRYLINRFLDEDIPALHQRISCLTPHYFNLNDPTQKGAFLTLVQHHGYPTPMLDWTLSPFIAAFFAFHEKLIDHKENDKVRIYIFNKELWEKTFPVPKQLIFDEPLQFLNIYEATAINNPRQIAQQAITMSTNVLNIEEFLIGMGKYANGEIIQAFDISLKERSLAINDLRLMGITVGTLFPGIDGVCEEICELKFSK